MSSYGNSNKQKAALLRMKKLVNSHVLSAMLNSLHHSSWKLTYREQNTKTKLTPPLQEPLLQIRKLLNVPQMAQTPLQQRSVTLFLELKNISVIAVRQVAILMLNGTNILLLRNI